MIRFLPMLLAALVLLGLWSLQGEPASTNLALESAQKDHSLSPSDDQAIESFTPGQAPASGTSGAQESVKSRTQANQTVPTAKLRMELVDARTGLPAFRLQVKLKPVAAPNTNQSRPEARFYTIQQDGLVDTEVPAGLEIAVSIWKDPTFEELPLEQRYVEQRFTLPACTEGETRVLTVQLQPQATQEFYVQFVDSESGTSIPNVRIHLAQLVPQRPTFDKPWQFPIPWEPVGEAFAFGDSQGIAALGWNETSAGFYEVHAPGYGPAWVHPTQNAPIRSAAVVQKLSRTATLHGTLSGPVPGGFGDLRIGASARVSELHEGDTLWLRNHRRRVTWETSVSVTGAFELKGLATSGPLNIWIARGEKLLLETDQPIRLAPSEKRTWDWAYHPGETLLGQLVDAQGRGVVDQHVWLTKTKEPGPRGTFRSYIAPEFTTLSGKEGQFEFHDLPAGRYLVGPAPKGLSDSPEGMVVEVPSQSRIVVTPPVFAQVSGTVRGPDGPLEGVLVRGPSGKKARSNVFGRFTLPCETSKDTYLTAESHSLGAVTYVQSGYVTVTPGSIDVEVLMVPSGRLVVHAQDAETRAPLDAAFVLMACDSEYGTMYAFPARSTWKLDAVPPGRYVVWASEPSGRVGRSAVLNIQAETQPNEWTLLLEPGGQLRLEDPNPSKNTHFVLREEGTIVYRGQAYGDKNTDWIPPGRYLLEWVHYPARANEGSIAIEVQTGGLTTVEIPKE